MVSPPFLNSLGAKINPGLTVPGCNYSFRTVHWTHSATKAVSRCNGPIIYTMFDIPAPPRGWQAILKILEIIPRSFTCSHCASQLPGGCTLGYPSWEFIDPHISWPIDQLTNVQRKNPRTNLHHQAFVRQDLNASAQIGVHDLCRISLFTCG